MDRYAFPYIPTDKATAGLPDWLWGKVQPIPAPNRPPFWNLIDIIGLQGIQDINTAKQIRFHSVGDTGRFFGSEQEDVAYAMAKDYSPTSTISNPAFFLHLGDVIYGCIKDSLYRDQFYKPYANYPGKIIALAGNHDGETYPITDPVPCGAFLANFCAAPALTNEAAHGVGIYRETMTQPGVYWMLSCPFVDIIALYSNCLDGPGFLVGAAPKTANVTSDNSQLEWLAKALDQIKQQRAQGTRKALIIAVHHPPFSAGGHDGSPEVLSALDEACIRSGVEADAVLSGHSHNYQRYTRQFHPDPSTVIEIPYVVAGCGGHNDLSVPAAAGQVTGDHTFVRSMRGYGYLDISVDSNYLCITMNRVDQSVNGITFADCYDSIAVNLKTHLISS